MATKRQSLEREEAQQELHKIIKPGDTVYCILRHVSRSGMQRVIDLYVMGEDADGKPWFRSIGGLVARAMGDRYDYKRAGVVTDGCGMDMGFHLVHNLSHVLWPAGYGCIGEGCRSNDHSNGDSDYTPHGTLKGCTESPEECHCSGADHWHGEPCIPGHAPCEVSHWHRDGGYSLRHEWI